MALKQQSSNIFSNSSLETIINSIKHIIVKYSSLEVNDIEIQPSSHPKFGDVSIPLHQLLANNKLPISDQKELVFTIQQIEGISDCEIVGIYLNIKFNKTFTANLIVKNEHIVKPNISKPYKIVVEYSSPNTNKPLHLGHIRNNVIGMAISNILEFTGNQVTRTCLVNDRGIHICKSMLAYQRWGNSETPETSGIKGDHLVGKYYVMFEDSLKSEKNDYIEKNNIDIEKLSKLEKEKFDREYLAQSKLHADAQNLLVKWENCDEQVRKLWETMNNWVYKGFDITYKMIGSQFDKTYFESQTYNLGKEIIAKGLEVSIFHKQNDGSTSVTLNDGSEKLLLRPDGTSVYITQDLGTAKLKYDDFKPDQSIYVVANEQDYHFKILFEILNKFNQPYGKNLFHLSYGMVELPDGKMKSREGTSVDADELIETLISQAKSKLENSEKITPNIDLEDISQNIALSAIKFYLLKTSAKHKVTFDPKKSLEYEGLTGPYLQYSIARINSITAKINELNSEIKYLSDSDISDIEHELTLEILKFSNIVELSADRLDPSLLANYLGNLALKFNHWYHGHNILKADKDVQNYRIKLIKAIKHNLIEGLKLLGISAVERM